MSKRKAIGRRAGLAANRARPSSRLDELPRYRVFISYSREDTPLVERIAAILSENGLQPMWDKNFIYGQGFHEQIKNFIAHAHVFLPVLTETAVARKWVHQEIGFSIAHHIPVLPIAVGELPGEMIQQIHALRIERDNPEPLRHQLSREFVEVLIERRTGPFEAMYSCADLPEDRARMMAQFADDVFALGIRDVVRQKGALSSFHLPTETIGHSVWRRRYGRTKRSEEHCRLQRQERLALGRHAEVAGCKLIIKPGLRYDEYGSDARVCRLECLLRFLRKMADDRCWVAIEDNMDPRVSVTILGNWFVAESIAGIQGTGYRQTVFTRHAPTIMEKLGNFDAEFDELLAAAGVQKENSRRWAIRKLEATLAEAKAEAQRSTASLKPVRLSVKVFIRNPRGRGLLLKRAASSKANAGKWEFPGGKLESGEDFDHGLLREVAEETGLTISLRRSLGTAEVELADKKLVVLILEAARISGKIRLSDEHKAYAWVDPGDLPRLDLVEQLRSFVAANPRKFKSQK